MQPIISHNYRKFEEAVAQSFERTSNQENHVKLLGLLFAKKNSNLVGKDLIPNRDYFHIRSGDNIDFLWVGWGTYFNDTPGYIEKRSGLYFDNEGFMASVKVIESATRWKYSGGTDLLLVNIHKLNNNCKVTIDYKSMIVCQLDSMINDKAISSVEIFFEDIFRFAENHTGQDPAWGFSDSKALSVGGSALKRMVLSLLPKGTGEDIRKLEHFAIRNVCKT